MKVRKVCGKCGSDNITTDAIAGWSMSKQEWVLDELMDPSEGYCYACKTEEIHILDEEVKE